MIMKNMIAYFVLTVAAFCMLATQAAPILGRASNSVTTRTGILKTTHFSTHDGRLKGTDLHPRAFVIDESGGDYHPWPKMQPDAEIVVIPFCYHDDSTYRHLGPVMVEAQKRWEDALGDNRGVMFEEGGVGDADRKYCAGEDDEWNPEVPDIGMLVMEWVPEQAGSYVPGAGYIRDEDDPFRNTLEFDPEEYDSISPVDRDAVGALTHELGHVLGFQHEHQRQDASKHILFKCENLDDYKQAQEWITKHNPGFTIEDACADSVVADRVRDENGQGQTTWVFLAHDFAPFDEGDTDTKYDGDFDIDSVMMYGSEAGAKNSDDSVQLWPIQKKDGSRLVAKNMPSRLDVAAVNKMYGFCKVGGADACSSIKRRATYGD